ncbi:MAG: MATE family efflux transporter [Alphaproteobacteria bacterium]|nr:MATE family efflux transporter [Alphaproteobacteria bacterium]
MTDITVQDRSAPSAWAEEARATLSLGWPLILTNLAQTAIMTTDVVMMGWLGPHALAAGALGANLFFAFFIFGLGISFATSPMLAQARGRHRHSVRDLRRTVRQGLWAVAFFSVLVWIPLWHTEVLLALLGQEEALASDGGAYIRAMMWAMAPALGFFVLRSFVSALERPRAALVITLLAIGFNALCDWIFMFGKLGMPALGVVGAGVASTASNLFMFVALLGYIYWDRRFRRYQLLGRFWRADWPRLVELLRIGLPIALTLAFEVTIFNAAVFIMGVIGTASLAAHAIAIQIASVTFMVPMGLSQAATVRVGLAVGRGDPEGVARAGWVAIVIGGSFMAAMALLLIGFPRPLAELFLDGTRSDSIEVLELAVLFLTVAGFFQIADGLQSLGAGALRGLKDTRVPMFFAGVGYWVMGLPFGVLLAFPLGLDGLGIWIGLATGLGIVAMLMLGRWTWRDRLGLVRS